MNMKKLISIQGNCLDVMKDLPDGSIDAVITDPPYGKTACKWDTIIPMDDMWYRLNKLIKSNGVIALFGSEPFSSYLRISNIKNYRYDWVWYKNSTSGFALAKKRPMNNHELISIFYNNVGTYNYIKEPRLMTPESLKRMDYEFTTLKGTNSLQNIKKIQYKPENKKLSYPKTVQFFKTISNNDKNKFHPTQKPVELMEYLIQTYTNPGETVLDFTMGSGTTGVACVNTGRNFIGIELDEKYFKIAEDRISRAEKNHCQIEGNKKSINAFLEMW